MRSKKICGFNLSKEGKDRDGYTVRFPDGSRLVCYIETATPPVEEMTPRPVSLFAFNDSGNLVTLGESCDGGELERMELVSRSDAFQVFNQLEHILYA